MFLSRVAGACSVGALAVLLALYNLSPGTPRQRVQTQRGFTVYTEQDELILAFGETHLGVIKKVDGDPAQKLQQELLSVNGGECIQVQTESNGCTSAHIQHRILLPGACWYGGPQVHDQRWPIEQQPVKHQRYVTNDLIGTPELIGSIAERYWISSSGVGLYIENNDPDVYYEIDSDGPAFASPNTLNYTLCKAGNLLETHLYMSHRFIERPKAVPDRRQLTDPIWSTWAKYKVRINQSVIFDFSSEIQKHGFSNSQLEIDDIYTINYGDLIIDEKKFPNWTHMTSLLHERGFRVTSWVHPFVNTDSAAFLTGIEEGYFVKNKRGTPGMIKWWQGIGCMIDMSNKAAVNWYVRRLKSLAELGIDSFKFDGGESCYMPEGAHNPAEMTHNYVKTVAQFGAQVEVRSAHKNQGEAIFLRMMDKDSSWGFENGLKTLIPSAFHQSIHGYPFILPDMIGGNAYCGVDVLSECLPDKELYIRWFQLTAFLPSMQVSISPWQFDQETIDITKHLLDLHKHYIAPLVLRFAEESVKSGQPIIRPLWWLSPEDEQTFAIEDQFTIGDAVLVAPVVEPGVTNRQIYMPRGMWKDMNNKEIIQGPKWIEHYHVKLDTVPYFENMDNFKSMP